MKQMNGWKCDGCGKVYDDREKCEECERIHDKSDKSIYFCEYEPYEKYPHTIYIRFKSGPVINYKMVNQYGLY